MRTKILNVLFAFFILQVNAQFTTHSPFTSFGFGEKGTLEHSIFTGVGNSTVTYFDSTVVNFFNPATYNTLGEGQPAFSLGTNSRLSWYNENNATRFLGTAMVDHFVMGIPFRKHFGLAFGLKPFSKKGYEVYDRVLVGTDSLKYTYLGSGGINQAFLGLSTNIVKFKGTTLSAGANLSYLFGTSTNERRSQIISATGQSGGVDINAVRISSFYYELGLFLKQDINDNHSFTLAAALEPQQTINGYKSEELYYASNVTNPNTYDTLYSSADVKGSINLAPSYTVGLAYSFRFNDVKKGNNVRNSEISFHVNYSSTDWSAFSSDFYGTTNLPSTTKLTFGLQFIPERKFFDNRATSNFLEKTRYRLGYYQYSLPYYVNTTQVQDMGATLGFGFPIMAMQSLSSVNFGFSFGQRTSGITNVLSEKYIGVNVGVILAPSNFDRWFRKRKLD